GNAAFANNGRTIVATGGYDGKVKLWDCLSGFCFVTFVEHSAAVMDVCFTPQGNAILTASLDGSVRAFDLLRYRNFRTFVAAEKNTGHLLDILSGHDGPVVSLTFHPHPVKSGILASGSWDSTVRIWDVFNYRTSKAGNSEPLMHSKDVLAIAFDPTGNGRLAASVLTGKIHFWNVDTAESMGIIEGLRDIHSGRRKGEKFAANNTRGLSKRHLLGNLAGVNQNQHFTSICFSSSGEYLLAASKHSPRICVYDVQTSFLLYSVQLTQNRSLDGILMELNSKYMLDGQAAIQEFDLSDSDADEDDIGEKRQKRRRKQHTSLPGVIVGENQIEAQKTEFCVWQIKFAMDGRQWAVATSQGVFVYSLDAKGGLPTRGASQQAFYHSMETFQPQFLTKNVNIQAIDEALSAQHYSKAFILSLALNQYSLLVRVYESIPFDSIPLVVSSIPPSLLPPLLNLLRVLLGLEGSQRTRHFQVHLIWLKACLTLHMDVFQSDFNAFYSSNPSSLPSTGESSSQDETALDSFHSLRNIDLRSLFLLLLNQIQQWHSTLNESFGKNVQILTYITNMRKTQPPSSSNHKN
ncbi:putative periodic tryptophan protein PWP2, partial [Cardiosporidium cionae]